jgi:hypothetical protein
MKIIIVIVEILTFSLFFQLFNDQVRLIKQVKSEKQKNINLEKKNLILKKIFLNQDFDNNFCITISEINKILNFIGISKKIIPNSTNMLNGCYNGKLNIRNP